MKKFKNLLILIIAAALSLIAVFASGCLASAVNSFIGNWQLDFIQTDEEACSYFKNIYLTVSKTSAYVSIEFTDDFINNDYSCSLKQGKYYIDSIRSYGAGELGFSFSDGSNDLYGWTSQNVLCINNCTIESAEEYLLDDDIDLYFTKSNKAHSNNGGNISAGSKFEDIKKAYKDAGYKIDVSQGDMDANIVQLVKSMTDMYAALGYGICVIGKNLGGNNVLGVEMYMLISTPSEEETREIVDAYKDAYKYALNGKDVIISIWLLGTPNFTPFNDATK